jgi:hypothetical protein
MRVSDGSTPSSVDFVSLGPVAGPPRHGARALLARQGRQAAQPPSGAQLDNRGDRLTPLPRREGVGELTPVVKRRRAWALRDRAAMLLRPEDPAQRGPSVCACGRTGHEVEAVGVHLSKTGAAWTSGTLRCNSGWLCPVCAPRRAHERQERVAEVYDMVTLSLKGQVPMVTLTVRHRRGMALADLRQVVQEAWRHVRQGAPWARLKKRFGVLGTITAPEVTYSATHGWHFHMHVAVPCQTSREGALEVGAWIIDRYIRYVRAAGYDALSAGQDVTLPRSPEDAARYLSKGVVSNTDVTWELAGAANKRGRSGSLHPFDILEAASGDAVMVALWREYAAAMKGARSCVISAALAARLGLDVADDLEAPAVEETKEEALGLVPAYVWNGVMRKRLGSTVLSIVEDGGPQVWSQALAEAYRIAGFDPPTGEATPPPPRTHAPTPEDVARIALAEAHQCRGRKGEAVGRALDLQRGFATARGLAFVPPDLRRVLELVGA